MEWVRGKIGSHSATFSSNDYDCFKYQVLVSTQLFVNIMIGKHDSGSKSRFLNLDIIDSLDQIVPRVGERWGCLVHCRMF